MNDVIVRKLEPACRMLAEAADAPQAKRVADVARAAEVYARRQKLGADAVRYATQIKTDALALLGEFLRDAPKNEGGRPTETGRAARPVSPPPTLADQGLTKQESSDAQALAELKESQAELFAQVRDGEISVHQARLQATHREPPPLVPPPPTRHPYSDMLVGWLKRVTDQTNYIHIECGGVKTLLAEPHKWNWREVHEYILPMLDAVALTIALYHREIEAANEAVQKRR